MEQGWKISIYIGIRKKKKKKETRKTAKCDTIALFTFNENPWAGFLSSMHFWLSFWLRFFFRGLPFRQKYKKKSQETIPCRDGNNDGRSTGKELGKCYEKEVGNWGENKQEHTCSYDAPNATEPANKSAVTIVTFS